MHEKDKCKNQRIYHNVRGIRGQMSPRLECNRCLRQFNRRDVLEDHKRLEHFD